MDRPPGGAALALVTTLIAQLKHQGIVDIDQMERVLELLKDRPVNAGQIEDADDAIAVLHGLKGNPPAL